MPAIDFRLNGLPLRGDAQAISVASGANPFAPRSAGGTTYKDFSIWSVWASENWQAGAGRINPAEGGFLYADAETRLPNRIRLPMRRNAITVDGVNATTSDRAHFTSDGTASWMGYGKRLYRWETSTNEWDTKVEFANTITSIAEFSGYIFVGFGAAAVVQSIDVSTFATTSESVYANIVMPFGGLLYIASLNTVSYTNYEAPIAWEGPLRISDQDITGMAGTMNGSILEQALYIATPSTLYALLPGDVIMEVTKWSGYSTDNGRGMRNHMGDVYVPLGRSMVRITAAGDLIPMGPDLGVGLPYELDGHIVDAISTLTFMYALVSPIAEDADLKPSVWAYTGEGWHQVMQGGTSQQACGLHYDRHTQQLFMFFTDGTCRAIFLSDDTTALRRGDNLRYESVGVLDTGNFFGDMREVTKTWGEIELHGCFPNGTSVLIEYADEFVNPLCNSSWSSGTVDWHAVGTVSANNMPLRLPLYNTTYLRLRLTLATTDQTASPLIEAITVKYIPRVVNQWAWNISVKLPLECLTYRDGSYVPMYDQHQFDLMLRESCMQNAPLIFEDIDGAAYWVAVTAFSRRVGNVHCDDTDLLAGDIQWSLSLLQLYGNITDGAVDEALIPPEWPGILPGPA